MTSIVSHLFKGDYIMSEPTLESIEDYNTLKGEKKKVVLGVIFVGLLLGAIYLVAGNVFDNSTDNLKVEQSIHSMHSINKIPMK